MNKHHIPLVADNYYHLFNRAIGREKLFISYENYRYFLQKMVLHVLPVADLFAYSLMPNHFHLLIRIKPHKNLAAHFKLKKARLFIPEKHNMADFIMERISNWLNAYTKAFNKVYNRKGSLFIDYTKRSEARSEADITSFILYIHQNAVHHGLNKSIGRWPNDSYQNIIGRQLTYLMRDEVIAWFGSKRLFEAFHNQHVNLRKYDSYLRHER